MTALMDDHTLKSTMLQCQRHGTVLAQSVQARRALRTADLLKAG
jgi:hypothetical protein